MAASVTLATNQTIPQGITTYPDPTSQPTGYPLTTPGSITASVDTTGTPATDTFHLDVDCYRTWTNPDGTTVTEWRNLAGTSFNGGTYQAKDGTITGVHPLFIPNWPGGSIRAVVRADQQATVSVTATLS